jgi:outer membrane scaffolding protein for murein synthesis (MipA/OmpV family)
MPPKNNRSSAAALVVVVLGCAPAPVFAKDLPLWELGLGVAPLYLPDYRGSDQSRGYVYPFPYVRYRGEILRVDDRRGLAALMLFDRDRFDLSVSANASQPAPSNRNDARQGMPDLDSTVELGPLLKIKLWENADRTNELSLQVPVRAAFALPSIKPDYIGVVFNPVIDWFMRDTGLGGGWRFGVQAGPVFTNRQYNDYYYRVEPVYATPDRPAYSPGGGYGGTQLTLSLNKRFGSLWAGAFVRAYDLHGAVFEDSPLVKQSYSVLGGFALAYVFAESKTRVDAED